MSALTVTVRISRKGDSATLADVVVPRPRGADWYRQAKSDAIMAWRRDSGDRRTSIRAEVLS